jgi:hypothetical protein
MEPEATQLRTGRLSGPDGEADCQLAVVGAHGGAGVTTLAVWLRPARDFGTVRRIGWGLSSWHIGGLPVVLVARNTLVAAGRARDAINTIAWRCGKRAVLAVVSDSLPEPIQATRAFDRLAGRVGAIVRVPFVASLRVTVDPMLVLRPNAVHEALAEIRAAALADELDPRTPVRSRGR